MELAENLKDIWYGYVDTFHRSIRSPDVENLSSEQLSNLFRDYLPDQEFNVTYQNGYNGGINGSEVSEIIENRKSQNYDIWMDQTSRGLKIEIVGSDPYVEINNLDGVFMFQNDMTGEEIESFLTP